MATYGTIYLVCLVLSFALCGIYVRIHSKQHDIHYMSISLLLVLINYSLFAYTQASSLESALDTFYFYYAAMAFLPPMMLRLTSEICKIKNKLYLDINYLAAGVIATLIIASKKTNLFVQSFSANMKTGLYDIRFGIIMNIFVIYILINLIMLLSLTFISKNKERISIRCYLYVVASAFVFYISGVLNEALPGPFDFTPISSVLMQIILIILSTKIPLYDVESVISESLEKYGEMGIVIFDRKRRLLGYDNHIDASVADFRTYKIDYPLPESFYFHDMINDMIDKVDTCDESQKKIIKYGDDYYQFEISKLLMNDKFCGYQLTVIDVTTNQKYIKLIEDFNTKLEDEVNRQTNQILAMQDKVILGIAEIIESRDNSTGGHIKRTSKLVEILTEELKKEKLFNVPPMFYSYLISAAHMHDLGKVAVPDSILNKPGKFTPEEYEQMKEHAAKGGIIVGKVLEELNVPKFIEIAQNVAHYHHERWDGNGYPDKLKGEQIPLEARIMAVADVYDALVSKRVYKDQFDYEKAYNIITEGMGTQFDPKLITAFKNCVPLFESYYDQEERHAE